jgi:hypothetical protein
MMEEIVKEEGGHISDPPSVLSHKRNEDVRIGSRGCMENGESQAHSTQKARTP